MEDFKAEMGREHNRLMGQLELVRGRADVYKKNYNAPNVVISGYKKRLFA